MTYRVVYGDALWSVYQLLGTLESRVGAAAYRRPRDHSHGRECPLAKVGPPDQIVPSLMLPPSRVKWLPRLE